MKRAFEEWWRDFSRDNARDVYGGTEHLMMYIHELSLEERSDFVSGLAEVVCARAGLSGIAAAVLESVADHDACELLHFYLQGLSRVNLTEEEQEATIVRILARADPITYAGTVCEYLFERPVGIHFAGVAWTQWPNQPSLFGRAFARYFSAVPPESLTGTCVIQAFLSTPEALAAVQSACADPATVHVWDRIAHAVRNTPVPSTDAANKRVIAQILSRTRQSG